MDDKSSQCFVRDLDLTLQPRIAPRYKTWLPLATQQLRLRSLVRVIGYKLETDKKHETCWFYYTLHRSSMSSPFFTSEPIDNVSARWASLEVPAIHATGLSAAAEIVVHLWRRKNFKDPISDVSVLTWGISFTGLAYIGPKLASNLDTILRDNSLIFHLHGGFFAPSYCLYENWDDKRYICMSIPSIEIRDSYTVVKLTSLRSKMQALKQQTESLRILRERIASGDEIQSPKYKQTSLNRLLQPKKISREKKAEILRIRKELEIAKFRTKLLEQERIRKMGKLRSLNELRMNIMEENEDHGSELMERYRELNKDMERLREWRRSHSETRDVYIQTTSKLAHRRRQLISELGLIYPIDREKEKMYTINNVHLPDSEELDSSNDTQVAVALGFVAHTTRMIANFLNVPTRYPILHYGSRSRVVDHVTDSLPDNERQFPLFARSKDKLQFHYAVYLLNKNIAQLRWYCGLPTFDLRATLPNLTSLMINVKPPNEPLDSSKRTLSGSSLDTDMGGGNGKRNNAAPLTPPIQKGTFEKFTPTAKLDMARDRGGGGGGGGGGEGNQLRNVKSSLGSSLDQGLDNAPSSHSLVLSNRSKRICKSEESAIDATKHLSLAREITASSDETLEKKVGGSLSRGGGGGGGGGDDDDDRFLQRLPTNLHVIERDIEIVTPVSVSKTEASSETTQDSTSSKQRSSNSISSCEMALSASQNDMDESSPNDNDSTVLNHHSRDLRKISGESSVVRNDTDGGKSLSSGESTTADAYSLYDPDKSRENLTELGQRSEYNLLSNISIDSSEYRLDNSRASLDDKRSRSYDCKKISVSNEVCSTASSYPENKLSADSTTTQRGYESESGKFDEKNTQDRLDGGIRRAGSSPSSSSEEIITTAEHSQLLLDENSRCAASSKYNCHAHASKDDEAAACEFRASTDYIDSIRRSSESVFARTEALASKRTSFKVMKPPRM